MDKNDAALPSETATTSPPATPATVTATATATDDEAITTSTESETFETWTLVMDRKNRLAADAGKLSVQQKHEQIDRVEVLEPTENIAKEETQNQAKEEQNEPQPDHESSLDDFSDGISIISESESTGRASPHSFVREQLQHLNLKLNTVEMSVGDVGDAFVSTSAFIPPPPLAPITLPTDDGDTVNVGVFQQFRQVRRRKRSSSATTVAEQNTSTFAVVAPSSSEESVMPQLMRRGLRGLFYVAVALALLAFIGKLRYPEWQPLGLRPIAELEQKLNDMELQNNLMRAEIDLLTRQVNYLSGKQQPQQGRGQGRQASGARAKGESERHSQQAAPATGKAFKAWPGNGNSMDPVVITKGDLRRPYKCADGRFVEIAGMCVEGAGAGPANVVDYILQNSEEPLSDFEKVVEQLQAGIGLNPFHGAKEEAKATPSNPTATTPANAATEQTKGEPKINAKSPILQQQQEGEERYWKDYRESWQGADNFENRKQQQYGRHGRHSHDLHNHKHNDDDDDNSKEERFHKNSSKEQRFNSKEQRFNGKRRVENSKERQYPSSSSKRQHKDKDGQWHENLMQQREQARRQNEHKNNKNWFIERGDSREQKRHHSGEKKYSGEQFRYR